ncbi:MAG: 50S ribosomal protein L29 [Candidatus Aenigmarchaeota archaeon]|nr:50S ribosomal protein L29 [Candidatus Aenigmarchaeota archaeon]
MALIRKQDLKSMDKKELKKKLEELQLELSKERAMASIGTAKSPGKIKEIRRTIARLKTIMGE